MTRERLTLSDSAVMPSDGNLLDLLRPAFTLLTEGGPEFQTGPVLVTAEAFESVLPVCVWTGLALHECGRWGGCDPEEAAANDKALTVGGTVVSRWQAQDGLQLTIDTTLTPDEPRTAISVPLETAQVPEPGLSAFELGDVLLDDSLHSVPLDHVWFALREHEMGSPGDTNLFPRRSSFPLGSTVVSWWTQPRDEQCPFQPFWVLTHLSKPRLTRVFSGASLPGNSP